MDSVASKILSAGPLKIAAAIYYNIPSYTESVVDGFVAVATKTTTAYVLPS